MNAKTPTRNRINARDAEDMTKIILNDAIKAEMVRIEKALEKLPKTPSSKPELKKAIATIVKPRGIGDIGSSIDIVVLCPHSTLEMEFDTGYCRAPEIRIRREKYDSDDLQIFASQKQWDACVELLDHYKNRRKEEEETRKHLNELKERRENYKDIAARFRLGFTGNPNDMDEVNSKAKEYLLAREA